MARAGKEKGDGRGKKREKKREVGGDGPKTREEELFFEQGKKVCLKFKHFKF